MRKLFLSLVLLSFAFILNAQDLAIDRSKQVVYVPFTKNLYTDVYTGSTTDLLTTAQDSIYINYTVTRPYAINYNIKLDVDTVAGADTATLALYGKIWTSDSWTQIATATYTGTADTVISYATSGTEVSYNLLQLRLIRTGSGGTLKLSSASIAIKEPYYSQFYTYPYCFLL